MKSFEYVRVKSVADASRMLGSERDEAKLLAGGTDLLGEMKDYIVTPSRLIAFRGVPNLDKIEWDDKGGLRLGALLTLARIQEDKRIREKFAVLSEAIDLAAMPQIRNAATIAGNLAQRPRCWYYRDEHTHCLKKGGDKCYAVNGENQYHAILGGGPCFIVHPSDPAPALVALGASVVIAGGDRSRTVPLEEFFVLPSQNVRRENILEQNEVITHVVIPAATPGFRSAYVKEREKDSYDWALAAAAVAATRDGSGNVTSCRIVLGGVAPKPWRAAEAEKALVGKPLSESAIKEAAKIALAGAVPLDQNAYKVPLATVVLERALRKVV